MKMLGILVAVMATFGCSEIPQDARKPFTRAEDTKAADASLSERAAVQNEYLRTGGAKP